MNERDLAARPAASSTDPWWPWRRIAAAGALLVLAITALSVYDIVRSYRQAVADAGRDLQAQGRMLAEQAARSLQAVDGVLRQVAEDHRAGLVGRLAPPDLHAYLKNQALGLVQAEALALFDADGRLVAHSLAAEPPQPPADFSADPAFQWLRAQRGHALLLGPARAGRLLSSTWFVPVARRLEAADGRFAGGIAASVRVDYFQNFYRDIRPEPGTVITLVHADGTLVARQPPDAAGLGQRHAAFDLLAAAWRHDPAAVARASGPDGREVYGVRAEVAERPLAVVVTREAKAALAGWRESAIGTAWRTLALVAMAVALLAMLRRHLLRLAKMRASLELSRERFALAAAGSEEGIWDWDVGTDTVYASPRAREIYGLPPGPETQPRSEWHRQMRLHPDDVARRIALLEDHLEGRSPVYAGEYRVRRADWETVGTEGTAAGADPWRWVRVRGVAVRGPDGRALRMAGSVTDIDAHRRAQDALRLSEERYALAMAGLTGGHWVWEIPSDALFVSPSIHRLFGLPEDTPVTTRLEYFRRVTVHPEDLQGLACIEADCIAGRAERIDFEYRIVLPGEEKARWILTRAQLFRGEDGQPLRMAGVSVDVTPRKETEQALRLSEERFALAVAGSNDGILDWDLVNDRMYASERAMRMLGVDSDVTTRTRAEWMALLEIHPEDRQRHADDLRRHLEGTSDVRDGEYRVRVAGAWRWLRVRMICVRDAEGRPTRLAGSVSDIDAYKRVEAALRESEERYAFAMTGSNEGHWVWDFGTQQVYVSARLAQLFWLGEESRVVPAAQYFDLIPLHAEDRERVHRARNDHVAGLTPRLDHEFRVVHPATGELRWVHTRAQCFRDEDGRPLRLAGSTVDITARKRAEEALRRSEERYALAVAGSDDGVWDWDLDAGIAFESARARQLQGLPPGPEVQTVDELVASLRVHPDDAPRRAEGIRAHLAGETPAYECDYRVLHDDGQYRWIHVRALSIRDATGRPYRMAGSVTDIDARKRAEEARRQSEERFALAVAGSKDGILDWDVVNDRMYVSERALQIVGIEAATPIATQREWADALMPRLHPEDAARLGAELRAYPDAHPPLHEGEYRVRDEAAGGWRWIRFRGMSIRDGQQRPVRWAGSLSDIDAQKKTEEALRRSDERYQLAVAGSDQGLWDWDLVTDSLFLSPRAQQLLWLEPGPPQRPRREWIALTPYHPDDIAPVREAIAAYLRGGTRSFKVEYRVRHHGGSWHWYRQRGIAVRDELGRPTRMAGSMEDITDRKNADAERDRLEAKLRQAQKLEAIGTLAGGIAHDFNNILAAILGYGEMAVKDAAPGSSQRRHIEAAISAGMRAKSLVERILAFSRSGIGERIPVHVQSVVGEALDQLQASLPAGITVQRRLDCGDSAVLGDPTQVHQVVMNLCANAVQAMRSQGTLEVALERVHETEPDCMTGPLPEGHYVRLRVRDTGCGIAPQVLERIFDPFFTTKEVGVGTGLGLSLVHGIVSDLGGGIGVVSELGAGSTFTVYLPWQAGVAPAAKDKGEKGAEAPAGHGETVLIVDDEEALVRLGEEMIAELGYEPVGFTSSRAALEVFRATPGRFDAVLSDESMPEMTGSELARAIRELRADIPIVLMSGYVTPALNQRARDTGVAEVLAKPLVARDIARSLAGALRNGG